jgi:hypothetical protein
LTAAKLIGEIAGTAALPQTPSSPASPAPHRSPHRQDEPTAIAWTTAATA